MYHTIQFVDDFLVDVEISPRQPLERVLVQKGTEVRAQIKPYVVETDTGLIEVADLYFENGTVSRRVRFACFRFPE